jgi:hypothetical protein
LLLQILFMICVCNFEFLIYSSDYVINYFFFFNLMLQRLAIKQPEIAMQYQTMLHKNAFCFYLTRISCSGFASTSKLGSTLFYFLSFKNRKFFFPYISFANASLHLKYRPSSRICLSLGSAQSRILHY